MSAPTALESARSPSTRRRTYVVLKGLILDGELRPGERLSESGLAQRLGVSRTPLREALLKLEEEGLVVGRRNAGFTVADLDVAAVCDLLVVREALDACAAEVACTAATDEDLGRIGAMAAELAHLAAADRSADVMARELDVGLEIHQVIAAATRNEALIRTSAQVYAQLRLALWLEVSLLELGDSALTEHQAIADALLARDGPRAAAAAREHVRSSLRNMGKVREILSVQRGSLRSGAAPLRRLREASA